MGIKLYFKRVQFAQDGNINFDVISLPIKTYLSPVYTVSTSISRIIFLTNILILIEEKKNNENRSTKFALVAIVGLFIYRSR